MSATRKSLRDPDKKLPPWQEILERLKPPSISLYRIYLRMGVTKSRRYWLQKAPDLRLSVAYRMALAAGIDPGRFMVAVALQLDPKPLVQETVDGLPITEIRRRERKENPPTGTRHRPLCGLCHQPGHNRKECPDLHSPRPSASLLLLGRGAAMAARELTRKGK